MADPASPATTTASEAANASYSNAVPATNPRTSPGTGNTMLMAGSATRARAAVVRNVWSSVTTDASSRSGHGSPVWPAVTES